MLGFALTSWVVEPASTEFAEWLPGVLLAPWMVALVFAWGAIWGSFGNVVIHRLPRGQSVVRPRSSCPGCGHPIAGFDNVPILSYLWLRGRCRHCGELVPLRYLVVELLAGLLSVATWMGAVHLPLVQGGDADLLSWLLRFALCWSLLVVVFIDLDAWIIPDAVVLPMTAVGLLAAVFVPGSAEVSWPAALGAAVGGYAAFAGLRLLYLRWRGIEALGLGDAKLLAMVGAFCGPLGVGFCVGAGALQGLLVAVPMLLTGRRLANSDLHEVHGDDPELAQGPGVMGQHVPFGPFLAVAALEYVLFGDQLLGLLGLAP